MLFRRLIIGTLCLVSAVANLAKGEDPVVEPRTELEVVLAAESRGEPVNRRLEITAGDPLSLWHRGILSVDNQPVEFENLYASDRIEEYLAERERLPLDLERHLQLARWCYKKEMFDQGRAHLHAMLLENPNDLRARKSLGHQWVGDRWFTPQEIEEVLEETEQASKAIQHWLPTLERVVTRIASKSAKIKKSGIQELSEIEDANAVFAMELLVPHVEDSVGLLLVSQISRFQSRPACLALVRIAMQNVSSVTSTKAAQELSAFHRDHYVPELLNMLSVPPASQSLLTHLPSGDLVLQRVVRREVQHRKELHRFTKYIGTGKAQPLTLDVNYRQRYGITEVRAINMGSRNRQFRRYPNKTTFLAGGDILADDIALKQSLLDEQKILDAQLTTLEQEYREVNASVMQVLAATQHVNPGNTPYAWWNWWIEENERYAKHKPTMEFSRYAADSNQAPEIGVVKVNYISCSCLIAGTPVQTERGLLAIDKVQPGDLVMAQNVESGELALKPVIQTTIRPPERTLSIVTQLETIHATPGHCWWVSGKGWLRTKELEPGMMLHTADGNAEVLAVDLDSTPVKTYNLVVADFSTYFVGQQRLLSYDNTQVAPTLRSVPGFGTIALRE